MPSTSTDRLNGLTTSVAVKAPCRVATTANITLSGLQTINSVTVVENDRVLVWNQTDQSENGIYLASTSDWTRAKDFNGNRDVVQGTLVPVVNGASGANLYEVTAANPITIDTTSITFSLRYGANTRYDQTDAEIAAGVTPTDYAYPSIPIIEATRYGFSSANTAAANKTAIESAISVAAEDGGIVQLPAGAFNLGGATDVIDVPEFVQIRGAGMYGTVLTCASDGSAGALFRLGGAVSGVVKYGCGLSGMGIVLTNVAGKAVQLVETVGARVKNMLIEGPINASRSSVAVTIDGGNASAFFNVIENVIANHLHIGYVLLTSGSVGPTQQHFIGCSALGDVATDTTSYGFEIRSGCGSGTVWIGGNFESCGTGARFLSGCQSASMFGARFEGNTVDVLLQATAGAQLFCGCLVDIDSKITDDSSVHYHRFLGCVNGSNLNATEYNPGQTIKLATVTGQAPLIIEGFPGDTTTETLILRNSAGQKLFSITNQGKFARINNAAPATVTGSAGGNAALINLLSTLAGYGLIVDGSS